MKRLAITVGKDKFSGSTPVAILGFLRSFRNNTVHNGISEGAAPFILPYFMDEPARHRYETQMGLWLEDRVDLYPRMVNWLLKTYADDDELRKAYQEIQNIRQSEEEDEKELATRLRKKVSLMGNVFSERALMAIYVDGLRSEVHHAVTSQRWQKMDFAALESMAYHLSKSAPRKTRDKSTRRKTATAGVNLVDSESEPLSGISTAGPLERTDLQGGEVLALDAQPWGQFPGSDFSLGSQTSFPSRGWRSPSASVGPGPLCIPVRCRRARRGTNPSIGKTRRATSAWVRDTSFRRVLCWGVCLRTR